MNLDEVLSLLSEKNFPFRESRRPSPNSVNSTLAIDQTALVTPRFTIVFIYEYENQEALNKDRMTLYKKFKKNYFDGEVVEIITGNIYMVTSKDKGEGEGEGESKLEKQLNEIFLSEK
ncbi:hypothetical protein PaeBR_08665 [Paenibacillus sp. BR2-3]|uniref:hypothetical protein n=1 Tax=Paenibacillus sp. BR2-3 TaxID=3048494 RepID=UPI003977C587